MEEIYDQIQRYIDILKGNIQEQKNRRQTLKEERAEQSLSYALGMEMGLACLQNLQDKVKEIKAILKSKGTDKDWIVEDIPKKNIIFVRSKKQVID